MSVTTLSYDPERGDYLLDLRMFLDDFLVVTVGGSESDYQPNSIFKKPSKSSIKQYLSKNLKISVNGKALDLKVDKIKFEDLVIYVTFDVNELPEPDIIYGIEATDTIFVDEFVNQRNVLHIELPNRKRRSLLFNSHYRNASLNL